MGLVRPVAPDRRVLLQEIDDFRTFRAGNPRAEWQQILPFFNARDQPCACLATFNNAVVLEPEHVAHEFALWGDFVRDTLCDGKRNGAFVLIEFEDARPPACSGGCRAGVFRDGAPASKQACCRSLTGCSGWIAPATQARWSAPSGPGNFAPSGWSSLGAVPRLPNTTLSA